MGKYVHAGVGMSNAEDPMKAGWEAVENALKQMIKDGGKKPTLGFVFCSAAKYDKKQGDIDKLVEAAHEAFSKLNPNCQWVGCTTTGELSNFGYTRESCVAMAIDSEHIRVGIGIGKDVEKDPVKGARVALESAVKNLKIDKYVDPYVEFLTMQRKSVDELIKYSPFHLLTICQGPLKKPGREDEVLDALNSMIGSRTPIIGGSSADDYRFTGSYQFLNGKAYTDSVILMALISHVKLIAGTEHGFMPTNKTFIVTDCDGRIVHKLNGRPAAQVLAEAYGSTVKELSKWVAPGYQKCFFLNDRNPILIVEGPGIYKIAVFHMIKGNDVILGTRVVNNTAICVGQGSTKTMMQAMRNALQRLKGGSGNAKISALILFDCCMRQRAFGEKGTKKEISEVNKIMKNCPLVGYYTYGEQTRMSDVTAPVHTNYTFTFLGISDKLVSE